ncbi:MAG: monooxygenase [Gammaproteobacteria bacterium]|nr:MAG: monooxygenase [Gammaproteobacteria bacterium]
MSEAKPYTTDPAELGFDPEKLRAKYNHERDKRVRKEGFGQYKAAAGDLEEYMVDRYVDPGYTREPLTDEVEVAIIGGGYGGLLAGARLREIGVESIRMIDKAGDFGGTWYWNRYPGAQCDIEAYVYMPLLDELDYVPTERYAHAPELLEHSKSIANKYDLYKDTVFQTEVTEMNWDENIKRWIIHTNRGDAMKAKYVAMANGPLTRPKLPGIPGVEKFKGHTFHTSRWDYDYTGGGPGGGMSKLANKRVGIIGTGATGIQCIPHLGEDAKSLCVFQRTPTSVDARYNAPTNPEWKAKLKPGWHKKRVENFNNTLGGSYTDDDMVGDGWTDIFRNVGGIVTGEVEDLTPEQKDEVFELGDFKKMQEIRDRTASIVEDPETAEKLKAYYRQFCKRPGFHDEYLQTYNRSNVTLVDTNGQGVDEITEKGVIVDGVEYELDCLIFSTGFETGSSYTKQSGYDLIGRNKVSLAEKWATGLATYHGLQTHSFPNCFILGFTQTGVTPNATHMLDEQASQMAFILKQARAKNAETVEVTQAAEDEWCAICDSYGDKTEKMMAQCTPGYYNNEGGGANKNGFISGQYGGGAVQFFKILEEWREEGNMQGVEVK